MPRQHLPAFSALALAVCAALLMEHGYRDFYHLRYLP